MADLELGAVNVHVDVELALDYMALAMGGEREEKGVSFFKRKRVKYTGGPLTCRLVPVRSTNLQTQKIAP